MSPPFGWGLVGGSGFAADVAGPALLAADGAKLVAVLSRDPGRARRAVRAMSGRDLARRYATPWLENKLRFSRPAHRVDALRRLGALANRGVTLHDDLARFLAEPGVDAVWVASPPALHPAQAAAALRAGKHVLCEKPLAVTSAEARATADAARASGRRFAVGYHMRQHPTHRAVRDLVRAGGLGRVTSFEAVMHFRHPDPRPWHKRKAESGGWAVCEAGTHLVDLARWLLGGEAVAVEGRLSSASCGFETDDRAVVNVRFDHGAEARIDVDAASDAPRQFFEVVGATGRVRCDETFFGQGGTLARDGVAEPVAPVDLHRLQVERFTRALRGDPDPDLANAEDGVANLEIIERARGW